MKIEQVFLTAYDNNLKDKLGNIDSNPGLIVVFGSKKIIDETNLHSSLREKYNSALLVGCTTAGEILDANVYEDSVIINFISFDDASVRGCYIRINERGDSYSAGEYLSRSIKKENLKHLFILSDGLNINGSGLVKGLTNHLPSKISLSGGLAGDGNSFKNTFVMFNDIFESNLIAAIGFYGDKLKVGCGSFAGWDPFGPERLVTRSEGNVLYELDSKPALDLYKTYLGKLADGLPSSGLLFPLNVRDKEKGTTTVRTILSVNEATNSLVFTGDIPERSLVRLMKANVSKLIEAATRAFKNSLEKNSSASFELALVISCFGRKLVLRQQVEEEIETVRELLGANTALSGFYSYGEIAPGKYGEKAELQNQTFSITLFSEN